MTILCVPHGQLIESSRISVMDLEKIAKDYHLAPQGDMFIENLCQEYELEWVRERITSSDRVLELGYGDGITFRNLSEYCDLSVVDGSKLIVEEAKKVALQINSKAKIYEGFFEEFAPEEKYNLVFASHVLEHVEEPEIILNKMKSWLEVDGKVIIIVPNAESIHRQLAVIMGLQEKLDSLSERDHLVGHLRVFTLRELVALLNKAGWEVLETRGFFLKPLANFQLKELGVPLIDALCKISGDLPPEYCANLALVARPTAK